MARKLLELGLQLLQTAVWRLGSSKSRGYNHSFASTTIQKPLRFQLRIGARNRHRINGVVHGDIPNRWNLIPLRQPTASNQAPQLLGNLAVDGFDGAGLNQELVWIHVYQYTNTPGGGLQPAAGATAMEWEGVAGS